MELHHEDIESIREDFRSAEYSRLKLAASSVRMWTVLGGVLSILFISINSGQAYWALSSLSGLGNESMLNSTIVGMIAVGLILAAKVIGIRIGLAEGGVKLLGVVLIICLMAFSIISSALHLSFSLVGGADASIEQSHSYKMALSDYELASKAYQDTMDSAKLLDEKGDSNGAGWVRGRHLPPLKKAADEAREKLEAVKKGGAGTEHKVLSAVSNWIGLTADEFSVRFSIFTVLLMELSSLFLSIQTGSAIRKAIGQNEKKPRLEEELEQWA